MVGTDPEQKNWKGVIIAVVIIISILAMIIVAIILVSPEELKSDYGPEIQFSHIFDPNSELRAKTFNLKWLNPDIEGNKNSYAFLDREVGLARRSIGGDKAQMTTLIQPRSLNGLDATDVLLSPSGKFGLVVRKFKKVRRYAHQAFYSIYTMATKQFVPIRINGQDVAFQQAMWFPRHDILALVHKNNVYVLRADSENKTAVPVTTNGRDLGIYNGIPDPLYEDELFKSDKALYPSPDGNFLAFGEYDDTDVQGIPYLKYDSAGGALPTIENRPYPMPGGLDPVVTVKVYNMETEAVESVFQTTSGDYVGHVTWMPDSSRLLMSNMNRSQKEMAFLSCPTTVGDCFKVYTEARPSAWVTFGSPPTVVQVADGYQVYQILPQHMGNEQYHRHLATYMLDKDGNVSQPITNNIVEFVTEGDFDDHSIVTVDGGFLYYLSSGPDRVDRHLYRLNRTSLHDNPLGSPPECLTKNIDGCEYVDVSFSMDGQHYLLHCMGPREPSYMIKDVSQPSFTDLLEDNAQLAAKLSGMSVPMKHYAEVTLDDKLKAQVQVMLPNMVDIDKIFTYPAILFLNGEPGEQTVTKKFSLGYAEHLSSVEHYVTVKADLRGAGGDGLNLEEAIFNVMGTAEARDLTVIAKHLLGEDAYKVDKAKTAIVGEGYGGYVVMQTLAGNGGYWHCGVASQAMSDPKYYYSTFGQRYLGLNVDSWPKEVSVSNSIGRMANSVLLQMFSENDERVPYVNQRNVLRTLEEAGIDSKTQVYPDGGNPLSEGPTREHYYQTLSNFFFECFTGNITHTPLVADWNAAPEPEVTTPSPTD